MATTSSPIGVLPSPHTSPAHRSIPAKPIALIVFLENVGHIHGIPLPRWAMNVIDFVTEEYAKLLLRWYGAYRRYDEVVILEDAQATGSEMVAALMRMSRAHRVDLLLLVHGHEGTLVGHRAQSNVGDETFGPLLEAYQRDPTLVDLRMVFGLNCYGMSLAPTWLALGAKAVNGAAGINWLPEPTLSIFLRNWLGGASFSKAVQCSHSAARNWGRCIWRPNSGGDEHPKLAGSRQVIFGRHDVTIDS